MTILEQIASDKRAEIREQQKKRPVEELREEAIRLPSPPNFVKAMRSERMGLVAEVKRKSPSAGVLREPFDPAAIARAYEAAGAQAVSVLMDAKYFGGGEGDFRAVRAAVALPLLYKEFVVHEWQVWHAASLGASAVLLIAALLPDDRVRRLAGVCREARLTPLVEVHSGGEMTRVAGLGAECIGINNRDLHTFTVSLETTIRLKEMAPAAATVISESGIRSAEDVAWLRAAGVDGILVGEHLLRRPDPGAAVKELMKQVWEAGGEE